MMVRWTETARAELADSWLGADSVGRSQISAAALAVDRRLGVDAQNEGESRPPLGILFSIERDASEVHVLRVWQFR